MNGNCDVSLALGYFEMGTKIKKQWLNLKCDEMLCIVHTNNFIRFCLLAKIELLFKLFSSLEQYASGYEFCVYRIIYEDPNSKIRN